MKSVVYATPKEMVKIFGWKRGEVDAAVAALVGKGELIAAANIDGLPKDAVLTAH
jgi:hypothetical protein